MATLQAHTIQALQTHRSALMNEWVASLEASGASRNVMGEDTKQQAGDFLNL